MAAGTDLKTLRSRLLGKTREDIRERFSGREGHVVNAVSAIDELDAVFNTIYERVREWYGFHFPELEKEVKDAETYLRLVYALGERAEFSKGALEDTLGENNEKAGIIEKAAKSSMGSGAKEEDLAEVKLLALNALNLKEERAYLVKYIEGAMSELSPNFTELCGPVVGARLLARGGSLKKLAMMPSSTIQIIGAERALFQAKKTGGKGPKHGIVYQHPLVKEASRDNKGKMARALAGKLSIALKEDYFGKGKIASGLKEKLEARAKELGAGRASGRKKFVANKRGDSPPKGKPSRPKWVKGGKGKKRG